MSSVSSLRSHGWLTPRRLNGLIATYEKRIATLKSLKSMIDADPESAKEVAQALSPEKALLASGSGTYTPRKNGQYAQMVEIMKDGEWRTTQEIADAVGVAKHSIAPYLYKDETKNKFDNRDHPEKPRLKQWRLKQSEQPKEEVQDDS